MDDASTPPMAALIKIGLRRSEADLAPVGAEPLPLFVWVIGKKGPTVKAVVGPLWTTVWRITRPGEIEAIDSVKTADPKAVRELVQSMSA